MASGYMLHVGERKESLSASLQLRASLQSLLGSPELAEMKIVFETVVQNTPLYSRLAKEIGMQLGSKWALTDATGRLVAQGTEAPEAADLRKAMDDAGMKSPIQQLREFLKANPDNLDARLDLLNILLETAKAGTKKALQLDGLAPAEARPRGRVRSARLRTSESLIFDLAPLEGKELDSSEDARIWGPYAAELDALFTNGDWRLLRLPTYAKVPLEAVSPRMVQLYRRHLPKIESALEEVPCCDLDLWRVYSLAHAVARRGSVKALMDRLVPIPYETKSWPYDNLLDLLMSEERAKGDWGTVAQELWSRWPKLKNKARLEVERIKQWTSENIPESNIKNAVASSAAEIMKVNLVPLVESLIKAGRVQDAETVLTDIARLPDYRGFQHMAANAALKCGRDDLSQKWLALEIPIKVKADKDDLDLMIKYHNHNTNLPVLVVANGKQHEEQINAIPSSVIFLDSELSEIMTRSYGLPDKDTSWLLTDANGKTIQSGSGLPDQDVLRQELEYQSMPDSLTTIERFVLAHPSHYGAKRSFLQGEQLEAERITMDKFGEGAGKDKTLQLSAEDDEAIWGEYVRVFHQFFPYFLEQSGPALHDIFDLSGSSSIHSQKMRTLAAQYLPRVEGALRRQPLREDLWECWFSLCPLSEKGDFKTFRESLAIPPMRHPMESPSMSCLLYNLWSRKDFPFIGIFDWQIAADVFSWVAEGWRPIFEAAPAEMEGIRWICIFEPLLEIYLHLGKDSEASALATLWSTSPNWGEIKPEMVDLAKKYGKGELAERWGKM